MSGDGELGEHALDAGLGATAVGIGALVGGPAGALGGAVLGPAVKAVRAVVSRGRAASWERAGGVLAIAAEALGVEADELAGRLAEDEQVLEVARRILSGAAETTLAAKLEAFARLLARLANDPEPLEVDETALLVAALSAVDAAHVTLLAKLAATHNANNPTSSPRGWKPQELDEAFGENSGVLRGVLAGLEAKGLVKEQTTAVYGGTVISWRVTDLGVRLLEWMETGGDGD